MPNAFDRRLTHTCTLLRASTTTNELNETVETYAVEEAEVSCRYVEKQERVFSSERGEWITVPVQLLLFRADQDVLVKDRFTNVTFEDGALTGTFIVDGDLLARRGRRSAHHLSVKIRKL